VLHRIKKLGASTHIILEMFISPLLKNALFSFFYNSGKMNIISITFGIQNLENICHYRF